MHHGLSSLVFAAAVLVSAPGGTHPHVFVGGGAHFGLNEEGQLSRLHVSWIYDTYASLYLLSYVQADKDGDGVLTEEEKGRILADQTQWPDDFAGDSYLSAGGARIELGKPVDADARILEDGRVEVSFDRLVDAPFRPTAAEPAVVKLYDPTFYYAYEVSAQPEIRGRGAEGCSAVHEPYDPAAPGLAALRTELSALGRDETPDQEDVGALFADKLILSCD